MYPLRGTFSNEKYVKRRVSDHSRKEAGLIAKTSITTLQSFGTCKAQRRRRSGRGKARNAGDIQDDPDYDAAGWGTESASLDYNSLIA